MFVTSTVAICQKFQKATGFAKNARKKKEGLKKDSFKRKIKEKREGNNLGNL